jgi:hypothetical protein
MQDSITMLDVEKIVNSFLKERQAGIVTLHKVHFKNNNNDLSYRALVEEVFEELKSGCITFINKNNNLDGINAYLFYIVNAFCKKRAIPLTKKKIEYVCPGCLFLGKQNLIYCQQYFSCDFCTDEFKAASDHKWKYFFEVFKKHSKNGWRCSDCDRFIPDPLDKSETVVCPYLDCYFAGVTSNLKKMNHPSSASNPEKVSLDFKKDGSRSLMDMISSDSPDALTIMTEKEELENKVKLISEIIENQMNTAYWNSSNFTLDHKVFVYQAIKKILAKYPEEMISYLLENSRSGGFQHKIFQEYVSILESSLPLPIKKGKEMYKIESLLDEHLCLFDGISVFDGFVGDKGKVKNGTKEYYIGGRKGSYSQPYYIGKLLNIIKSDTKDPILHHVKEYSFNVIKLNDIKTGTPVTVTHLRVPPHYQMGGMVYVNRIRKKIVDKANLIIKKDKNA